MAAGIAALEALQDGQVYRRLEDLGVRLESGLRASAEAARIPVTFHRIGSMFCTYFADHPIHHLGDAMRSDRDRFARFFHGMLGEGIYFAPSQFEAGFLSAAHSEADIDATVAAAERVMRQMAGE